MPRKKKPLPTISYERFYRMPGSGKTKPFKELEGSGWQNIVQEEEPIDESFIRWRDRQFHYWGSYDLHRWITRLWDRVTDQGKLEPTPKLF